MNATSRSLIPDRKILASGIVGIVAYVLSIALERWGGIDIPFDLLGIAIVSLMSATGYLVPASVGDFLARLDTVVRQAASDPVTETQAVLTAGTVLKQEIVKAAKASDAGA